MLKQESKSQFSIQKTVVDFHGCFVLVRKIAVLPSKGFEDIIDSALKQ